jgi:hypothetical protein
MTNHPGILALSILVAQYRQLSDDIDTLVVRILDEGVTYTEVGEILGYTRQRVHQLYGPSSASSSSPA